MIDKTHDTTTEKPVRVIGLFAENVKNLRIAQLMLDPHLNLITGPNASGKSSLVDSIMYALAGGKSHPRHMIRRGEDRMVVRLGLGDDAPEMTAIRTAYADREPDLRLEAETGAVLKKPQHILDAIASDMGWEPIKFMNLLPKQQMEVLRKLVKDTVDVDLDAIDGEIEKLMEERRIHRPTILPLADRELRLRPVIDPDMDVTPVSLQDVYDELEGAVAHNATIEGQLRDRAQQATEARQHRIHAEQLRHQAKLLLEQAVAAEETAAQIDSTLASAEPLGRPIDISGIREKLNATEAEKKRREEQVRIRDEYSDAYYAHKLARKKEEELTEGIESFRKQKRDAISRTKMPIDGLSFDDDSVTYNGLPLSQASQAEQWRVVVAIGMAMNPRLRIMFVREGSLLDRNSLRIVEQMAEEYDFQVLVEMVQEDPGTVGIHMRDGEVVAINGIPQERPKLVAV